MTSRILATAHNARMIKARGIGERDNGMARAAILICSNMCWCFAFGDVAVMAIHTLLSVHFRAAVIEGTPDK